MKKSNLDSVLKAWKKLDEAYGLLEDVYGDEEDIYNNRSEKWQESDKGEEAQCDIDSLSELRDSIESARDETENFLSEHDIEAGY